MVHPDEFNSSNAKNTQELFTIEYGNQNLHIKIEYWISYVDNWHLTKNIASNTLKEFSTEFTRNQFCFLFKTIWHPKHQNIKYLKFTEN